MSTVAAPGLGADRPVGARRGRLAVLAFPAVILGALLAMQLGLGAAVLVPALLMAVAIARWPPVGLYLAFGLVLLFEGGGPDPLMAPGSYLLRGLQSSLGLRGFILSPIELTLLFTLVAWLARGIRAGRLGLDRGRLFGPMVLFSLTLAGGLARGLLDGADPYIALWEARALGLIPLCYLLAANLIRTPSAARVLIGIFLLATGLFAVEGAYRELFLIRTGRIDLPQSFHFAHESVIFLDSLIALPLALWVARAPRWQRLCSLAFTPIAVFTLLASQRRAGIAALLTVLVIYGLVFLVLHRRAFFLVVLILVGVFVSLPVFWTGSGLVGQPARALRSAVEPDARDASSNDYRALERINVRATILANPLFGVGFGREFSFVVPLPDLSWWPFWRYQPHHNLLWLWLKTGLVGFVAFWLLVGRALALAGHLARTLRQPDERAMALLVLAGIVCTLVFSYVDLGLTNSRVTLLLGTILGTLAVLGRPSGDPEVGRAGP